MTDQANTRTDVNRRRALKALAAAAGAASIAALPSRWSKPVARIGAMPAHAQVSGLLLLCDAGINVNDLTTTIDMPVCVTVSPPVAGIELLLDVIPTDGYDVLGPGEVLLEQNFTYLTDGAGQVCTVNVQWNPAIASSTVEFVWSFANSAANPATCSVLWRVVLPR